MRYDKFEKRIKNLNKVVNGIYRCRGLLITLTCTAIVGDLVYNGAKGTVTLSPASSLSFVYGDEYNFDCSAFNNASHIEYCVKNTNEWTTTKPKIPGQYTYRGVSKNGFGGDQFSKKVDFEILPYDVDVSIFSNSITYGEKPVIKMLLIGKDHFVTSSYEFEYDDEYSLTPTISLKTDTVRILDENNNDISYCYNVKPVSKQITINPKLLIINYENVNKVYDGDSDCKDGVVSESTPLVEGDQLSFGDTSKTPVSLSNQETYLESFDYTKEVSITRNGISVNHFYDIQNNTGNVKIAKIPLKITSKQYNGIYDGKSLEEHQIFKSQIEGNLLEGDKVNIEYAYESNKDNIKPIEFTNSFNVTITNDSSGEIVDKTNFYYITKVENNVKISTRSINLILGSSSKIFDGTDLFNHTYNSESLNLAEGDSETIDFSSLPKISKFPSNESGNTYSVNNDFSSDNFIEIKHGNGEEAIDVTDCYTVIVTAGTLTLEKCDIEVDMKSFGEIVYDGVEHSLDTFEINRENSDPLPDGLTEENLVLINPEKKVVNVNGTTYEPNSSYVSDNEVKIIINEVDYTNCFNINYIRPTSKILKKTITPMMYFVTNEDDELTYNGTEQEVVVTFGENDIVDKDEPYFDSSKTIKLYKADGYSLTTDFGFNIFDKDTSESTIQNYSYEDQYVYINKKELDIILPVVNQQYDGNSHSINYSYTDPETGDEFISTSSGSIQNAGDTYTFESSYITTENIDCYDLHFNVSQTVSEITKRDLVVVVDDYNGEYDGENHTVSISLADGYSLGNNAFQLKETEFSIKDAGTYTTSNFAAKVMNANSEDVTNNYNISYVKEDTLSSQLVPFESCKIDKFSVEVSFDVPNPNLIYLDDFDENNSVTYDDFSINRNVEDLPAGETLHLVNPLVVTSAGDYHFSQSQHVVVYKDGVENTSALKNYNITYASDTFTKTVTLEKKELNVKFADFEQVFNGDTFEQNYTNRMSNETLITFEDEFGAFDLSACGLTYETVFGDDADEIFIEDDKITNFVSVKIKNSNGTKDLSSNFDINYTDGDLNFTPFDIKITIQGFSSTYNGSSQEAKDKKLYTGSNVSIFEHASATTDDETKFWDKYSLSKPYSNNSTLYSFEQENYPVYAGSYNVYFHSEVLKVVEKNNFNNPISSDYYTITVTNDGDALYTVNKKLMTITLFSGSVQYTGSAVSEQIKTNDLIAGDSLYIYNQYMTENNIEKVVNSQILYDNIADKIEPDYYCFELIGPSTETYTLSQTNFIIKNSDNIDVTSSYSITLKWGLIEIYE